MQILNHVRVCFIKIQNSLIVVAVSDIALSKIKCVY